MVDELTPAGPALGPDATYDAFLAGGVLAYQRCAACERAVFPPRPACPACGAEQLVWHRSQGAGVVHAASTIAPRGEEPYCVALVDLAEGFRMMTNVVGVPADQVAIGSPVRVRIEPADGRPLPLFEAAR